MKCAGCLLAAILVLSSFWAVDAWAMEKPRLIVFMIESHGSGLKADEVVSLSDYLSSQMAKKGRYQVLPLPKAGKGKAGKSSIKLAGGPPDFVLSSSIHRVGDQCLLMAGLYDPQAATMNQAVTGRMQCEADAFIAGLDQVAQKLSTGNLLPASVPVVAVFHMENRGCGISAGEAVGLTEYLAAILVERRAVRLFPRDYLIKRFAVLAKPKWHAATLSISSAVARVKKQCLLNSTVFDLKNGTMVKSVVGRVTNDPDRVVEGIEEIAKKLANNFILGGGPAKGSRSAPHPSVPAKAAPPAPTKASSAP